MVLHGCVAWCRHSWAAFRLLRCTKFSLVVCQSKRVRNPTKSIGMTSMTHQQAVHLNRRTQFSFVEYGSHLESNVQRSFISDDVSNAVCLFCRYYLFLSLQKKIASHFEFHQKIFYTLAQLILSHLHPMIHFTERQNAKQIFTPNWKYTKTMLALKCISLRK